MSKMLIFFRKSFPAVHEARPRALLGMGAKGFIGPRDREKSFTMWESDFFTGNIISTTTLLREK